MSAPQDEAPGAEDSQGQAPKEADAVRIRPATPDDAGQYLTLVDALAAFERLDPPDSEAKARLIDHLFGDRPYYKLLVAEVEDRVVAYAAYVIAYSTFLAKPTFYLEDLFVLPEHRHHRIGHRMMIVCARTAVAEGCGRMDFMVLGWNEVALDFYRRHDIETKRDWVLHRAEGAGLEALARQDY